MSKDEETPTPSDEESPRTTLPEAVGMEDDGEEEGDDFDLRTVSATQIACPGYDLIDLLCYDEAVTPETFRRLGLTYREAENPETGFPEPTVEGLDPEAHYLITFPEGADLGDFTIADALTVEDFPEKCFNDLAMDDSEMSCDGDCDNCPQDCIGKRPVE